MRYKNVFMSLIVSGSVISSPQTDYFTQYQLISGHSYVATAADVDSENILVTDDFQFFDLTFSYDVPVDFVKDAQLQNKMAYKFASATPDEIRSVNQSILDLSTKYTSLIKGESVANDPLWPLAVSNVEYNYANAYISPKQIVSWPVDIDDFKRNNNYLSEFTWKNVERYGLDYVLKRTGGAIGVFQIERGFGAWASPILPAEFGGGGARTDCWLTLGEVPDEGHSIAWKLGLQADRWNYSDALNIIAGTVNKDIDTQKTRLKFNVFDNKYGRVTLLMWGHNFGGGVYSNESKASEVSRILTYIEELRSIIVTKRPYRYNGQQYFKSFIEQYDLPYYPTAALASYMILEYRTQGAW